MGDRTFRGKPSESHIVWTRQTRDGTARKRFDTDRFERWAARCGFDFETDVRVDHARADEPREQYRCVFAWGTVEADTIALGDEEWSMGQQTTPATFVEIDSEGQARVKGWSTETKVDLVSLRHDGRALVLEADDGDRRRLDTGTLVDPEAGP